MRGRRRHPLFSSQVQPKVGFIIWRGGRGDMQVLTHMSHGIKNTRELCLEMQSVVIPPEEGMAAGEYSALNQAVELVKRETGLGVKPTHFVGLYGPDNVLCTLYEDQTSPVGFGVRYSSERVFGVSTITCVFAGKVIGGSSAEESVGTGYEWMSVQDVVARHGENIMADQGQHLKHLVTALRCNGESCFQNPGTTVVRFNGVHVG